MKTIYKNENYELIDEIIALIFEQLSYEFHNVEEIETALDCLIEKLQEIDRKDIQYFLEN